MSRRRIAVQFFIDIILALEHPIGITELVSKTKMDHRLTTINVKRLVDFGLLAKNEKISLTSNGMIIYNMLKEKKN